MVEITFVNLRPNVKVQTVDNDQLELFITGCFQTALCGLAHKPMGTRMHIYVQNAIRKLSHTNAPHVEFRRWKTEFPTLLRLLTKLAFMRWNE